MTDPTYYMADDYSLSRTWSTKYRKPLYGQEAVQRLELALEALLECFTDEGMVRGSRTECLERIQAARAVLPHFEESEE